MKKELIDKKIEESNYAIWYSKGSLIPGNTKFTKIIIVDDVIYKATDGNIEYRENQKVTDKVWNYINLMQGVIRSEAEKVTPISSC